MTTEITKWLQEGKTHLEISELLKAGVEKNSEQRCIKKKESTKSNRCID